MEKQFEPNSDAAHIPEDRSSSAATELQYVSLKIDGEAYGGWYRVLHDGRMELLALATMHRELRTESTALEQARGMLTEFIRSTRLKRQSDGAAERSGDADPGESAGATLGDLLYTVRPRVRS